MKLYSCSPRQVSRKLWTVHETVSCMQQLRERYAWRSCYYARASLWRQRQGLNYAHRSLPSLPLSCTGFNFYWLDEVNRSIGEFTGVEFRFGLRESKLILKFQLLHISMEKLILISGCYENHCENRFSDSRRISSPGLFWSLPKWLLVAILNFVCICQC